MANNLIASTFQGYSTPIADPKTGLVSWTWLKKFQQWDQQLTNGLNQIGQLQGEILASTVITGRSEGIGTTVGKINSTGVVTPPGMVPATDSDQGAVILPAGASSNILGSAALASTTDFDPTGAAATAQSNAETYADGVAATAQSNAEAFASDASNIATGTLATARLGGITGTVTLAMLTTGGTNGSLTFTHGLITGAVDPT